MNIIPIKQFVNNNANPINTNKKYTPRIANMPIQDTVCFSGKKVAQKEELSENVQESTALAKKLYKLQRANRLNFETISQAINSRSPVPIEIKSMDELPESMHMGTYNAYMQPFYNDNFEFEKATIYLKNIPQDKKERLAIISSAAHEYTHILQRSKDDSHCGLKPYSQDIDEARFYKFVGTLFANQVFGQINKALTESPKNFIPQKALQEGRQVQISDLESMLGGKENAYETVNNILEKVGDNLAQELVTREVIDPDAIDDEFMEYIKEIALEYTLTESLMEIEAHQANEAAFKLDPAATKAYLFNNNCTCQIYKLIVNAIDSQATLP